MVMVGGPLPSSLRLVGDAFGSLAATCLLSVRGWTQEKNVDHDMGMLILERDLGHDTGYLGIVTGPDSVLSRQNVTVSGYPKDKSGKVQWYMNDQIKSVAAEKFYYDIDTMGGQSGSGDWSVGGSCGRESVRDSCVGNRPGYPPKWCHQNLAAQV